jgi:hypothetical protein
MGLKNMPALIPITDLSWPLTMTPASVHDTNYLTYCTIYSLHTKQPIGKVYADEKSAGKANRDFLPLNDLADGTMQKDSTTTKLAEYSKNVIRKFPKSGIS